MNIQISIAQIENGYIVQNPPSEFQMRDMARRNEPPQPIITYCEGYEEVCARLKEVWPVAVAPK